MEDLKQQMLITGEGLCLLDKQNRVRRTVVILSLKEDKCENNNNNNNNNNNCTQVFTF